MSAPLIRLDPGYDYRRSLSPETGVGYSHATGEFYSKAAAIKGSRARIAFLVRAPKWEVKRFEKLPEDLAGVTHVASAARDSA